MYKRKKKEAVYRRKGSNVWYASFSDASGKRARRSTETTDKKEAVRLQRKWATEAWEQKVIGIEPDRSFE